MATLVIANGLGESSAFSVISGWPSETTVPVFINAAACLRLAGVIRLTAPSWSSLPQRPQFES